MAFHANTTTYLQLTMQEVSSATTPALHSSRPSSSIPTKGPTTATDFGHFGSRACLSRNHLGSPRGVEWQEGDRQRERERERGKKEGRKSALLERLACCYFWLRWYLAGRPSVIRRCKTRKATFSVLCEATLLSHSQRTDGRSENAVLQALSLRLRVRASERSAHATTIDSDSD